MYHVVVREALVTDTGSGSCGGCGGGSALVMVVMTKLSFIFSVSFSRMVFVFGCCCFFVTKSRKFPWVCFNGTRYFTISFFSADTLF